MITDKPFRLTAADIDQAFERDEFTLVFQPKIELSTGKTTAAEAFVRWHHPQFGLLPPGLFLEFVEAQGRMVDLTSHIFHTAFVAARKWTSMGRDWSISVNVSPGTIIQEDFCRTLANLIQEFALSPDRVIIEVPERAIAHEPVTLCQILNDVRALGVQIALDGGGIVPVDLNQFDPMPFTSIKVGGPASIRLAQRLGLKGKGAIAARLRFAQQFKLETVAVGAEDESTMAGLADLGFTAAQGIWIQQPLPIDELLAWDGKWVKAKVMTAPPVQLTQTIAGASARAHPTAHAAELAKPELSRDDVQRALEAVRLKRAHAPVLQPKPDTRLEPAMPVLEADDLEDIVEDEEAPPPGTKTKGFGAVGNCPPMKGLVERRSS